jgi:hypothetical protein
MTFFSLRQYSGHFRPKVIARIRRQIAGRIAGGQCVVVVTDGAVGLTPEIEKEIRRGFPPSKVRFSNVRPGS